MTSTAAAETPTRFAALAETASGHHIADEVAAFSLSESEGISGRGATGSARAALRPPAAEPKMSREPLSPELVLVCPQLRMMALDALPERPWEAFLPPASDIPPVPVAAGGLVVADSAVAPFDDDVGSATASVSRRGRGASLVTVGLIVGFIAAQFVPQPARPTLVPTPSASRSAERTLAPAAPGKQSPGSNSPVQSAAGPAPSLTSDRRRNLAVPRGGYIFGRSGRFQVAPDRLTVRMFHARVKCAPALVIPAMSLRGGSRFSHRGQIRAGKGPAVRLEVAGRFLDSSRVRGFIRARSPGCDSGKVRFLARLS